MPMILVQQTNTYNWRPKHQQLFEICAKLKVQGHMASNHHYSLSTITKDNCCPKL